MQLFNLGPSYWDNTLEEERKERLSLSCYVMAFVFFLVLSQFVILLPNIVSKLFRPFLCGVLILQNWYRKTHFPAPRIVAFLATLHCIMVTLLQDYGMEGILQGGSATLFLLMLFCAIGFPWNNREIRFIMLWCLIGATICAIILLRDNGVFQLSHSSIYFNFLNTSVNRNRNAYAFALGTVIGLVFLRYGSGYSKALIMIMTIICGYGIIYSQCRGAFLSLGLASIILYLDIYQQVKHIGYWAFFGLIFLTLVILIGGYYLLGNGAASRLVSTVDTGRGAAVDTVWSMFLKSDFFHQIFGHGYLFEIQNNGLSYGAHNVYASNLLSTGLYGAVLYFLIFIATFRYIKGIVPYAFFVLAFCRTFVEGMDYYVYIPLILSIIIYQDFRRGNHASNAGI